MRNPLDAVLAWLARGLARAGLIDGRRGDRTVELAWPRIVTGVARLSQRVADFAMVGAAIGPAALAGLAFAIAFGTDGVATGVLRGSGDTRWPFYGKQVGLYGAALPIAYLAVSSPLGIVALYVALFAETAVPAAVTYYRFHSGAWLPPAGVDVPAATD